MNILHYKRGVLQSIKLVVIVFSLFIFSLSTLHAQPKEYTLLEPLRCIPSEAGVDSSGRVIPAITCDDPSKKTVNFEEYVQYIFNLAIALSAALAVFMIVWGGFKYVSTDSFMGKNEGKDIIFKALQGLLLVLTSYLILQTIDPRLVAIPANLVEPLEIKCIYNPAVHAADKECKSPSTSYFERLDKVASQLRTESLQLREQILETDQEVKKKEAEQSELIEQQKAAEASGNTDLAKKLEADINENKIDINNKLAQVEKDTAIGVMKEEIVKNTKANTIGQFNDAIEKINRHRDTHTAELTKLGAYEEIKVVNNHANYSESYLELMKLQKIINETSFKRNISFAGLYSTEAFYPSDTDKEEHQLASKARGEMDAKINTITKTAFNLTDSELQKKLSAEITITKNMLDKRYQGSYK